MSKADVLQQGRLEGMYYALNRIEKDGIEAFKEEMRFRQAFGCTLFNTKKELKDYSDAVINRSMQCILVFAVATLHDEFGFGQKRCQQFIDRFNTKASCLTEDYITWEEQCKIIEEEIGIHVNFT